MKQFASQEEWWKAQDLKEGQSLSVSTHGGAKRFNVKVEDGKYVITGKYNFGRKTNAKLDKKAVSSIEEVVKEQGNWDGGLYTRDFAIRNRARKKD